MKTIPRTKNPLVLRTDFSDQAAWEIIRATVNAPVGVLRFRANVEFVDDRQFADVGKTELMELIPSKYAHSFIVVVDAIATSHPDHPLLVLELYEKSGQEFRATPSQIQGIENNLSIANMDFEEFAGAVDEDGVFRGFPES